ncbi:hypothetical protein [Rhodanobacter terrae]|uniref:hypothetical protein n=1 Tax=Rhodanobacter terrae TaxID=418647 RepID=UPI00366A90E7
MAKQATAWLRVDWRLHVEQPVIPAQAGTGDFQAFEKQGHWVAACTGMTSESGFSTFPRAMAAVPRRVPAVSQGARAANLIVVKPANAGGGVRCALAATLPAAND